VSLILGDTFPDIRPSVWVPLERDLQDREEAGDGWTQINSYEPPDNGGIIFAPEATWNSLTTTANRKTLTGHWRRNSRKQFHLFNFWQDAIAGLYAATGNGIASRFTLPAKSVSGLLVYIDTGAGPVAAAPQPAIIVGGGADQADDIQFAGAVANGAVITFDAADARRRYDVIYQSVEIAPGHRGGTVWTFAANFIEQPRSASI
jgi:hypothetical protein